MELNIYDILLSIIKELEKDLVMFKNNKSKLSVKHNTNLEKLNQTISEYKTHISKIENNYIRCKSNEFAQVLLEYKSNSVIKLKK